MAKKSIGEDGIEDDTGMMTMPECASYLHLSESTILKLAMNNKLPGLLIDKKWRFQRELIDEWLHEQLDSGEDSIEELPDGMRVPLGDLLPAEAMMDLESTDALSIIEEMAARAYIQKWLTDKPWFVGAVIEREALSSTAMEGGVAFLHTRAREASKIARPFIIVGRSYNGVEFGAPDGKPTFIFFMLGLKYDRLHLPILGRLARAMRNQTTITKLRSQPSPFKMRALLLREDAESLSANLQVPAVKYEEVKPTLDRQLRLRTIMRLQAMRKHEAKKADDAQKKSAGKKSTKRKAAEAGAAEPASKSRKPAAAPGPTVRPGQGTRSPDADDAVAKPARKSSKTK
jgi:excisionase family DNA binding protein